MSTLTFTDADLAAISASFERAPAAEVVAWAVETFGDGLCLAASMADAVLIDVATKVDPSIEVVFLDTQYHFPETLATARRVEQRYRLKLRVLDSRPRARRAVAHRHRCVLPGPQGRSARPTHGGTCCVAHGRCAGPRATAGVTPRSCNATDVDS